MFVQSENPRENYQISRPIYLPKDCRRRGTAREHDEQIATSLALTHLIGRTLSESGATQLDIDTEGYKRLLHILEVVERDTWQLFTDMHHYNPYAGKNASNLWKSCRI